MDPVVHFEVGYNDRERIKRFYSTAFDWKMQQLGAEMNNYVVAQTTDTDDKGMIKTPGSINGGFYQKIADPLSHTPSFVIGVKDIEAAMKKVIEAGGKILGAMNEKGGVDMTPQMIPGVGLWISAMDTEENRFSMLQPLTK